MTDKENIEDQDVELQETDEEISEMKHDPKMLKLSQLLL